ncbi:OmpP1/FadL family transporter [Desulforegula conservatrix]|uniref:OmpP1/FadL family transporter n=1 Tax=Desulforegula conservatrix TaxID=153026 RepID=UPI0012EB769D|nr:outer membrane protein transport protein [Desulforegula conservatrix]
MKFLGFVAGFTLFVSLIASESFALGPGFAGVTANADTAETVVTNPAGMTRFKKASGYGSPMVVYMKSETKITETETGRKQSLSDESVIPAPGFSYIQPIDKKWAIGVGPNAVAGLGASYDNDWLGRYFLKEWSLNFAGIAPSAAYRVNDKLSVGASIPLMYSMYSLEKAIFNGADTSDGSFELEADGWGAGVNLGILYEPTKMTRLGLVYRSKVSVSMDGSPDLSGITEERRHLLNQDVSFDTGTPQVLAGGIYHEFQNDWSFSLDVAWVDFSDFGFEEVEIGDSSIATRPADYNDLWAATLGVNYRLSSQITLQSGAFYVSAPMDEEDHTVFMRLDQIWGAGMGFDYRYGKGKSLSFDLTYVQFGDGRFNVQDVPLAGSIEGAYTTNYALVFGIGTKW